jgi:nitrogen PTS system EIIA component
MADFDLHALARYLHLTEGQLLRMAERGGLPGRKVSGEWRFNAGEIHHWLEDRIGAAGEKDLAHLEEALEQAAGRAGESAELGRISELLTPAAIALPLEARTRGGVIKSMVKVADNTGWLWVPEEMEAAIRERENLHSTALENGVALLHPRRPMADILAQPFLCLGRTLQGIPFGNPQLTDVFFLIASTNDAGHLHILARLSRLLATAGFLELIRTENSPVEMHQKVAALEAQLLGEAE